MTNPRAPLSPYHVAPASQEQQALWQEYKETFRPELLHLSVQDDARRFGSFMGSLRLADARNALETDPVHGVTKFSSLTQVCFAPAPELSC
jgi:hypothetical protein